MTRAQKTNRRALGVSSSQAAPGRAAPGSPAGRSRHKAGAIDIPGTVRRAASFYHAGQFTESQHLCALVLAADESQVDALHLFGLLEKGSGHLASALDHLVQASRLDPANAELWNNIGTVLRELGRPGDALVSYRRAIDIQPDFAMAYCNLGVAQEALGRDAEAMASFEHAIRIRPEYAEAMFNRANVLKKLGRYTEAVSGYQAAVRLRPDYAEALNNCGALLCDIDRPAEALANLERAIAVRPEYAQAHYNLGIALAELNRLDDAVVSYRRAVAILPDHAEARNNLGNVLTRLDRHEEALRSYQDAVSISPTSPDAHNNAGTALRNLRRHGEALVAFRHAIELRPGFAEAWNNLGMTLKDLGRHDDAIAAYGRAIEIRPEYATPHLDRALLWLLRGDYRRGWREYEWRFRQIDSPRLERCLSHPRWQGDLPVTGKRVLLHAEQGHGDTIQFCRYAPLVRALGADVILEVQAPLLSIIDSLDPGVRVVARGTPLPAFDLHCPLMSLPLAFGTALDTIPAARAYLCASPALERRWQDRLGQADKPRIGIAWSGNPDHNNDRERSIALPRMVPLFELPAEFHSLQTEYRDADADYLARTAQITTWHDKLANFGETAALISALDLVVTVDTSVAHLAGALGKPVWILLPCVPDFRWLLERDDSPWYPSARLFRQRAIDDWDEAIHRVRDALRNRFTSRDSRLTVLSDV